MAKNLVKELVALFQGQKLETVEQAFKEAMQQWPCPFSKLFDTQMKTLQSRGCPKNIIDVLTAKKDEVIAKALEMEIPEGHIPFIPVTPRTEVDFGDLMKMVRNREFDGRSCLYQHEVSNVVDVPNEPYFIYDVENGKDMLGKSPVEAEKFIKEQDRSCLTADEGIALCVHTSVLSEHYVDCTGSRYGCADEVPYVSLFCDWSELNWCCTNNSYDEWGSASCRSRA